MPAQTKRQQLESHLAARAIRDPEFRDRLVREPKAAIEQEIGLRFPDGVDVEVHEEKLTRLHVVLPVDLLTGEDLLAGGPATREHVAGETPFWKKP
jgi:hypothetical protein